MYKDHYISLFKYETWANRKIAEALHQRKAVPEKSIILFNHIGAASDVWYSRVTNEERVFDELFSNNNLDTTENLVINASEKWIKLLNSDDIDLKTVIKYQTIQGKEYENTILDVVTQLVTHGPYHRGQINILLRQNGFEPARTDYIYYVRE